MSKISTIGQDFFLTAVAAWDKGMDKMLKRKEDGKALTGSFTFKYEIPAEFFTDKRNPSAYLREQKKDITVKVAFKALSSKRGHYTAYKAGSTAYDTTKNIVFNNTLSKYQTAEDTKRKNFSVYIHELQHIAQDYNGFGVVSDRGLSHHQCPIEHEACLAQVLYALRYESVESAAEVAVSKAEYMQFDFRKFVCKAYLFGCTSSDIVALKGMVTEKMNEITSHPLYNKIHQDSPLLVMFGIGEHIILNFVEKERARLGTEKHPKVIGWLNENIAKYTKMASKINKQNKVVS
jgi:hypothetical protein